MAKADERAEVVQAEAEAERVYQAGQRRGVDAGREPDPVIFGNEERQRSPGSLPLKPRAEVKDAATQAAWLAEAKEIERVLLQGDHASPVTVCQLLLEAIPVIEAYVPPAARDSKKKDSDDEKRDEAANHHKRQEK